MEDSLHENICGDCYTTEYDDATGREYLTDSPTATGIYGHIEETYVTQESKVESVNEMDKAVRFRLLIKSNEQTEAYFKLGSYFRPTMRKHYDTNSWISVTGREQYIVRFINQIMANGRYLNIGLERKDYE